MKISLEKILKSIIESSIKIEELKRAVILIGGTGCVGKSLFSEKLATYLHNVFKTEVSVLDLDCYLIEREIRESGPQIISGYNPEGYELSKAMRDIKFLLKGRKIKASPYDKAISRRTNKIQIEPAEILIIEGVMALTKNVRDFGNIRIFFDADEKVEYKNRLFREGKLGFTRERTNRKFALLRKDYEKFIAPQRQFADIIVNIGYRYNILKIEINRH